jgi:hypothetical protein
MLPHIEESTLPLFSIDLSFRRLRKRIPSLASLTHGNRVNYTLTRAKQLVIFVGMPKVMGFAVKRMPDRQRYTALADRLRQTGTFFPLQACSFKGVRQGRNPMVNQ